MKYETSIYGVIGGQVNAEQFVQSLPEDATEIIVRIHSVGGSVGDALAIYNALVSHQAEVTTIVDGYAASSASFIMLAGDKRLVYKNSIVFVHHAWTVAEGNAKEINEVAQGLEVHDESIRTIYRDKTNLDDDKINELMDGSTYFGGEDALQYGFATEVIEGNAENKQIAAMVNYDRLAAIINKESEMSKQKTRKEIEAEALELSASLQQKEQEVEEVKAEAEEVKATIEAEAKEEIEAKEQQLVTVQSQLDEINARIDSVMQERDEAKAQVIDLEEKLEGNVKALEALKAKLELAPYNDSDLKDVVPDVQPQADAQADAEEIAAMAEEVPEPQNELEQYEAMDATPERKAFWQKNKKSIIAQMNERNKGEE